MSATLCKSRLRSPNSIPQLSTAASLDLLCHVVRHQPAAPLLILGTHREEEISQNPALERAVAELTRLQALTTLVLASLQADDITALAANYLGGPLAPALGQFLYAQNEGNPFFAEELLHDWLETGVLAREGSAPTGRSCCAGLFSMSNCPEKRAHPQGLLYGVTRHRPQMGQGCT